MIIELPKFNTRNIEITIKNYNGDIDEINFNVEDCSKKTMFKKSINNGIVKTASNKYLMSIYADDTKDMQPLLTYKYFIEILINKPEFVMTKQVGDFIITESSTELGVEINV